MTHATMAALYARLARGEPLAVDMCRQAPNCGPVTERRARPTSGQPDASMVSESNAASAIGSSDPPSPAAGPDGVAPHPAGAAAELFVPCTRSVVRPGVPDFVVPLARVCVARTTYQPGLRF